MIDLAHTLSRKRGEECLLCPGLDGKPGSCDHSTYARRYVRFVRAHQEAYDAAYLDSSSQAAANELERLGREYRTLPRGHDCSCWPGHCLMCKKIDQQRVGARPDVGVTIGRTALVNAPTPRVDMLDLAAGYAR